MKFKLKTPIRGYWTKYSIGTEFTFVGKEKERLRMHVQYSQEKGESFCFGPINFRRYFGANFSKLFRSLYL